MGVGGEGARGLRMRCCRWETRKVNTASYCDHDTLFICDVSDLTRNATPSPSQLNFIGLLIIHSGLAAISTVKTRCKRT